MSYFGDWHGAYFGDWYGQAQTSVIITGGGSGGGFSPVDMGKLRTTLKREKDEEAILCILMAFMAAVSNDEFII